LDKSDHEAEREAILDWLIRRHQDDYIDLQNSSIGEPEPRTGQWFLFSEEFQKWLKTDNQTLFCPGIPGAGKTFITSIVVDYLFSRFKNDSSISIAYLYCKVARQGKQTPVRLFESILKQLVRKQSPLPQCVKDLYKEHKDKPSRPKLQELVNALQSVISPDSRVFIIVDALDECQDYDNCRTEFLSKLFSLQNKTGLNLFATSRPQEVEAKFSACIRLEIHGRKEDIERYVDGRISQWETLHDDTVEDKDMRDMIKTKVTIAADGM
jgi:Cdc6-like AAA superfamily ATPase